MPVVQIILTVLCIICFVSIAVFFFKYLFLPILLVGLGFYLYTQLTGKRITIQTNRQPFRFYTNRTRRSVKPEEKIIDVDYTEIS